MVERPATVEQSIMMICYSCTCIIASSWFGVEPCNWIILRGLHPSRCVRASCNSICFLNSLGLLSASNYFLDWLWKISREASGICITPSWIHCVILYWFLAVGACGYLPQPTDITVPLEFLEESESSLGMLLTLEDTSLTKLITRYALLRLLWWIFEWTHKANRSVNYIT